MSLGIEDELIQADHIRLAEYQIEILQRLCGPEALHAVRLQRLRDSAIRERGVRDVSLGVLDDVLEHFPGAVLKRLLACDAVENEDGFNGLRAGIM